MLLCQVSVAPGKYFLSLVSGEVGVGGGGAIFRFSDQISLFSDIFMNLF